MRRFLRRFRTLRGLGRRWYRYQLAHPPRPRAGEAYSAPDFVGVGAQKAGTTWWYELLAAHPEVSHRGRPKELHFFDRYWDRKVGPGDAEDYARYFPRRSHELAGEWTPGYMSSFWVPAALRAIAPEARLLVLLRDPVERYRSGLSLAAANTGPPTPMRAREAFRRGFYAEQLEALLEHFPRERVLVLQYERCRSDPRPELARTYEFLGVDAGFVPGTVERERNPSWGEPVALPPLVERALVEAYAPDVKRLSGLAAGIDLALWPNFADLA